VIAPGKHHVLAAARNRLSVTDDNLVLACAHSTLPFMPHIIPSFRVLFSGGGKSFRHWGRGGSQVYTCRSTAQMLRNAEFSDIQSATQYVAR
jgi:hypothetical protein